MEPSKLATIWRWTDMVPLGKPFEIVSFSLGGIAGDPLAIDGSIRVGHLRENLTDNWQVDDSLVVDYLALPDDTPIGLSYVNVIEKGRQKKYRVPLAMTNVIISVANGMTSRDNVMRSTFPGQFLPLKILMTFYKDGDVTPCDLQTYRLFEIGQAHEKKHEIF